MAKPREPSVPPERRDTARQSIIAVLEMAGEPLSAKDISAEVGLPEKDVYAHLEHIQASTKTCERRVRVTPAECKRCGFSFRKRERLTKPGKCPLCKSEQIEPPLFSFE